MGKLRKSIDRAMGFEYMMNLDFTVQKGTRTMGREFSVWARPWAPCQWVIRGDIPPAYDFFWNFTPSYVNQTKSPRKIQDGVPSMIMGESNLEEKKR